MATLFSGSYSSRFTFVTKTPCLIQVLHSIHRSSEEPHNRLCKQHVLAHFITRSWTNCVKPLDRVTWCHVLFTRDRSGTARSTRFGTGKIQRSAHTVYLCVLFGSENKQRLFPYTVLTGFYNRDIVFTARYGLNLHVMYINPSKPSGHYMYHQFDKSTFCPYCIWVLSGSQNKQRLFPYTALTEWFFIRDGVFTARYGLGLYMQVRLIFCVQLFPVYLTKITSGHCLGMSCNDNGIEKDSKKGRRLVPADEGTRIFRNIGNYLATATVYYGSRLDPLLFSQHLPHSTRTMCMWCDVSCI